MKQLSIVILFFGLYGCSSPESNRGLTDPNAPDLKSQMPIDTPDERLYHDEDTIQSDTSGMNMPVDSVPNRQ